MLGPVRLGEVASGTSYTSGNDVFGTALTSPRWDALRLCLCVSAAAVPYVRVNGVNMELNLGAVMTADRVYTFTLALPLGTSFNLRFSASNTIRNITVDALSGDVL